MTAPTSKRLTTSVCHAAGATQRAELESLAFGDRQNQTMLLPLLFSTLLPPEPDASSDCHEVRATAVYEGVGWSHYVQIANLCDVPIACTVATDIDPEPRYDVFIDANDLGVIRTRYGSPSPLYTPLVSCELT
jgi:hypothetical protein